MSETANNETPEGEPPVNRGGAPKGSQNALRHGLNAGKLPRKLAFVENAVNAFRRRLEAIVLEVKGEVTIGDAATINSACKWERHGMLAQAWLRKEESSMTVDQRLKFSETIAKASDARDKCIRSLGLDKLPDNPWIVG